MAAVYKIGQANAVILARFPNLAPAQARSFINDRMPHAQSQALILVTTVGIGFAMADILSQSFGYGQSNADILARSFKVAQAQVKIA